MEYLLTLDRNAFLWINTQLANPYLDFFLYAITWLGNGWIIILLVGLFFALQRPDYLRQHLPWLATAMLVGGLCIFLLKNVVPRPRPLTDFAPLIEAGKVHLNILGEPLKYRSFPSGHAQTAFAVGTYLSLLMPRWTPLFLSLAGGVGFSRIYIGAHFPLDVIVGGMIGAICTGGAWLVRKRLRKPSSTPTI